MKKALSALSLLLCQPIMTQAAINFHITQATEASHGQHSVRAVVTIEDKYNEKMVTTAGGYDPFHSGLLPGDEKNAKWEAGWVFNTNISGYYGFYFGCNVDSHQYIEPTNFPVLYIQDKTDVDVTITCPLAPEGCPTEPKIDIRQRSQK